MAKVTSKLQLTVPKAIADRFGIRPGDELQWSAAGEGIRVTLLGKRGHRAARTAQERLELFDQATERQRRWQAKMGKTAPPRSSRGWRREDLYGRDLSD